MNKFFSPTPIWQGNGIALLRILIGSFLIYHGWEVFSTAKMAEYAGWDMFKNSSSGKFMVYAGKASELIAGFFLVLGLLTRLTAIVIILTFIYITFFVGQGKFWMDDQHPFLFALFGLLFIFTGPGNFCADNLLFNKK